MDTLSLADVFWSALVLCGATAEVLDRLARRRARSTAGAPRAHSPASAGV